MHLWASVLVAFSFSFVGCWIITRSRYLRILGNVDPTQNRWHQHATPGLGGIPLFLALASIVVLLQSHSILSVLMLIAATPLMILGAYDDLKTLTPINKLLAQIGSAVLMLVLISFLPSHEQLAFIRAINPSEYVFSQNIVTVIYWIFCVFWMVAIVNAINLLDNMDGLSGGVSFIICLTIAIIAWRSAEIVECSELHNLSILYFSLSASLAGFLLLNINPAKLFMGDAGSLWIGLMIATGTLLVMPTVSAELPSKGASLDEYRWLLPIVTCTVPISDTAMVVITRKLRGQAASLGGSDHLSHRLVCLGLSQRMAVGILWLVATLGALLALLIHSTSTDIWLAPFALFMISVTFSILFLTRVTSAPNGVATRKF